MSGLQFTAPWALAALALLPAIWWLLRVTPPAPRAISFPAVRMLLGLTAAEQTPARTPWWLLALRMAAAALVVVALAGPVLRATGSSVATPDGSLLLVVDDGWASAADWPRMAAAAGESIDRAGREGRKVALLSTAPRPDGAAPAVSPDLPAADARSRLDALRPLPWPADRLASASALDAGRKARGPIVYVADGISDGPDFPTFSRALSAAGEVTRIASAVPLSRLMLPPRIEADRLIARVAIVPRPAASHLDVLARTADGRTFARIGIEIPAGAATAEGPVALPPELRNRLARLELDGPPSAGGVALLDEQWRRRPVGLLTSAAQAGDAPLTGSLFFLRRALNPFAELREGGTAALLGRALSVLVVADAVPSDLDERAKLLHWVEQGGTLVRFAGPELAAETEDRTSAPDPLLPEKLLPGDRRLGGAMSWGTPSGLAPFAADSPFAGLAVPDDVKISRQVLAQPSASLAGQTWASLADGTPLVTAARRGAGSIVLVHVTANADWSNLPLSGLFVDMLRRIVGRSVGVAETADATVLAPAISLDGFGQDSPPPVAARGLPASSIASSPASPQHPPGLYGPEANRRALSLGSATPPPEAAPPLQGAQEESLGETAPDRAIGPSLLAAAILLLVADLLASLALRGLLARRSARVAAAIALIVSMATGTAHAAEQGAAALTTRLAYVVTGDARVDDISRAGLAGLSDYVVRRTAAVLVTPDAVTPGEDDLSLYPLLYWPVTSAAAPPSAAATAALNAYMANGGILLIDTQGGGTDAEGSGAGFAPDAAAALRRATTGLAIPPLTPLSGEHVLARAFYLLPDFPGRFDGDTVWVQRDQDRANDSVSPVIVGGNDWAAAWAIDRVGANPYAMVPGGARQRVLAYRFGVNLVMYALTGNYKGDQVHVPAILERLGQ